MSSEDMYDELQTLISKFNTRYHFRYVLLWNESNDDISLRVFDYKKLEWQNIFLHKGNKFNSVREMNVFIIDMSRIVEKDMIERL
jgi:hypothetical protein